MDKQSLNDIRIVIFLISLILISSNLIAKDYSSIELPIENYRYASLEKKGVGKLYRKGLSLFAEKKYIHALVKFNSIVSDYPEYEKLAGVQFFIGLSYDKMDMHKVAMKRYKEVLEKYPKSEVVPFANLGIIRTAYKDNNAALVKSQFDEIQISSASDSLKNHAIYYYAEQLLKDKNVDEAIKLLKTIPPAHPEYHFAQHSLAVALFIQGVDGRVVLESLDNVILKPPMSKAEKEIIYRSYLLTGYLYYNGIKNVERKLSATISALRKVPETSSYYDNALIGMAWTSMKASQWADCISSCIRLRDVSKNDLLIYESKLLEAYCYMMDKKWVQSNHLLENTLTSINKFELNDNYEIKKELLDKKLLSENKKYEFFYTKLDSLLNDPNSAIDVGEISSSQKTMESSLSILFKNQEELFTTLYLCRKIVDIKKDVEYALAKSNKNISSPIMLNTVDCMNKITKEEEIILYQLKALESSGGGGFSSNPSEMKLDRSASASEITRMRREIMDLESLDSKNKAYEDSHDDMLLLEESADSEVKSKSTDFKVLNTKNMLKAASHDDNEEFLFYQDYCNKYYNFGFGSKWNIKERYILKCVDADNNTLPFVKVDIYKKKSSKILFSATSMANGEIILFPYMDLDDEYGDIEDYYYKINGGDGNALKEGTESVIILKEIYSRKLSDTLPVQVCFLLDATGSMKDEIDQLKDVIFSIHHKITSNAIKPKISFSTVAYRDISDSYHYKKFDFTGDIDQFQINLEQIKAGGGGDYPEDLDKGLEVTLDQLSWKKNALKFVFLIGDAPPHLDYNRDKDYVWAMKEARKEGIMICPIGASGLRPKGEFIYRQIGVITNGEFIFLHYGESGESSGKGTVSDPGKVSHHTGSNYNVKKLDDIVVNIINTELGYLTSENMIVQEVPEVDTDSDFLDTRMENLVGQIFTDKAAEKLKEHKVVISPFTYKDSIFSSLSDYLWETTIEKVTKLSEMQVIERQKIEDILKEHSLDMTGITETGGDSNIGELLSSDYIIFSSLKFLGSVRVCHMRLVECSSGEILSAARIKL